jgi:ferritin-like metal-binding protein YciE
LPRDDVYGDDGEAPTMTYTLEISDELKERMDKHLEDDETHEEFIEELVSMYETEGAFLQEGYSE